MRRQPALAGELIELLAVVREFLLLQLQRRGGAETLLTGVVDRVLAKALAGRALAQVARFAAATQRGDQAPRRRGNGLRVEALLADEPLRPLLRADADPTLLGARDHVEL